MPKFAKLETIRPVLAKEEFDDDDDNYGSSEEDEEQHSKFLDAIKQLNGKKKYESKINYFKMNSL